MFEVLFEL